MVALLRLLQECLGSGVDITAHPTRLNRSEGTSLYGFDFG